MVRGLEVSSVVEAVDPGTATPLERLYDLVLGLAECSERERGID